VKPAALAKLDVLVDEGNIPQKESQSWFPATFLAIEPDTSSFIGSGLFKTSSG